MEWQLLTQAAAAEFIARIGDAGQPLEIKLGEDLCFNKTPDGWVEVGTITLFPDRQASTEVTELTIEISYDEASAVKFGGFEWEIPDEAELWENLDKVLNGLNGDYKDRIWKSFSQGLQDVLRRTHLLLPVFDANTVADLPLQRPMTIVADTSAVHQGGLDFVGRFLVPRARIKIPATVHMELVQQSDDYFKIRRSKKDENPLKDNLRSKALDRHLLSQGGQRTLVRLRYDSQAELDRSDLGTDPLRSILTTSKDPQDTNLGMLDVVKSFGDRLIVETAHLIRIKGRSDHPVVILTSDQGMARMAIAEGLEVFFFQARSAPQFVGKRLTGTLFHPFKPELYTVSLTSVLWELAVSFGCLQLHNPNSGESLELWGIGGPEWQPLHARDDLLWGKFLELRANPTTPDVSKLHTDPPKSSSFEVQDETETTGLQSETQESSPAPPHQARVLTRGYRFSPDTMFEFIKHVNEKVHLTDSEVQKLIRQTHPDSYQRYKKFLKSGQFIYANGGSIDAQPALKEFWQGLVDENPEALRSCLLEVPSFKALYDYLKQKRRVEENVNDFPISVTALPSYLAVGEAAGAWLKIYQQGIVVTDQNEWQSSEFTDTAVKIYERLSVQAKTEWVLTGQWLEELAIEAAIHPVISKALVAKARSANLLQVYAEGSTPDTRFDRHTMWLLKVVDGNPKLIKVYLYHGDFLIPGTSSVRIKLQGVSHAP